MALADVPAPGPPGPGRIIVRPEVVGICGSDLHLYSGDVGALSGVPDYYPRIQGHELSAIVEDVGEQCPPGVSVGSRVAIWPLLPCGRCYPCRTGRGNACVSLRIVGVHRDGGLQQRLDVPAAAAIPVGDLEPSCTAFVEPTSVAIHALGRARLTAGEQVVVFGAGPIGLAAVIAAGDAGARTMVIDPLPKRRCLAGRVGAERAEWGEPQHVLAAVREWTCGDGAPLVIETSGDAGVLPRAVEMACSAGRIVVVGMSSGTAALRPGAFPEKEIDVIGSSCATAGDFRGAARLVAKHCASVASLLTHRFPLECAREALEFVSKRPPDAVKVVVTIGDEAL